MDQCINGHILWFYHVVHHIEAAVLLATPNHIIEPGDISSRSGTHRTFRLIRIPQLIKVLLTVRQFRKSCLAPVFYKHVWLSKILTNGKRCYIFNVICHWLEFWSNRDKNAESRRNFNSVHKYIHRPQKVYERFCLPRIRPLRCDYFNKSLSENPCM